MDYANSNNSDPIVADEYRAMLIEKGLSRSHLNNSCFAIKKFFEMNNQVWNFTVLRSNNAIPYYFNEEDVLAIFSVCSNIKHLAMLQTLFYGCLRSSELCKIDDNDLDFGRRSIHLRETKNGSDGIAYINRECAETLRLYLKIRPQIQIGDRTPLFYTDSMNFWAKNDVHRMFQYYKMKAGLKKQGGVHVFSRHTPATIMIAKGCDCRIVQEVLRHRDIRTTLRYAHVSDKTKREKYEQYLTL